MAAKKVNPIVEELRLPEGYTVRLVRGELKVVAARKRKVVAVAKESKSMPKKIEVSIRPFGSSREQLWIGAMTNGEFTKEKPLYKAVQSGEITATKSYSGTWGKASTSESWEITIPDDFPKAVAKSRLSDASFKGMRHNEYEVIHG